jgi:hypothetical protein
MHYKLRIRHQGRQGLRQMQWPPMIAHFLGGL